LPGDGVGPEVANAARALVERTAKARDTAIEIDEFIFGGAAIDAGGDPFPAETKTACVNANAVFLGAVGGPKWDGGKVRPEAGLLALRKELGVFANLRPIIVPPGMEQRSPLTTDRAKDVDILIVRELTGGVYFGDRVEGRQTASDVCVYSREEVERVARIAFEAARGRSGKVTSVDKANVMATGRLWRAAVTELHEAEYSDVALEHVLVDAMAMKLIQAPRDFDVVVTENMFGDILSDEASVIAGSIGLAPSASLGAGGVGLYEPIHGAAPDIAGRDKANPIGAIMSAAMMFRHSALDDDAARMIENAVSRVIASGAGTPDIGGEDGTQSLAAKIVQALV
ncbi:MAG: 3-isopropylmalate dehydrogenase, partial [Marinicaulis sp.]|nr:3-isopropylmalate dehydrogenase [Marinicaulis sp.]